jgi:hypothetical protein
VKGPAAPLSASGQPAKRTAGLAKAKAAAPGSPPGRHVAPAPSRLLTPLNAAEPAADRALMLELAIGSICYRKSFMQL